jgi:indole-3-acetate monooxygenase
MIDAQNLFTKNEKQLLISHDDRSEEQGTLTSDLLELARSKKLYHLAVPEELGGAELPVVSLMEIFEEASSLNGSFGWNLTLGAGAGIFGAYMDPDFAREVFGNDDAFITGSGYPAGTAQPDGERFKIDGKWKYASGASYATLFSATCVIPDQSNDQPELRAMAFYPDEVMVYDTWNSYGLTATASQDFEVKNVQVPHRRSFTMMAQPEYAGRTLYRFPFMQFASATLAASMLGITQAFLDESGLDCDDQKAHIQTHRSRLYESVETVWEACENGRAVDPDIASAIDRAAIELAEACRSSAFEVYQQCGMTVLDQSSRLNRTWRDLMTAGQHAFLIK